MDNRLFIGIDPGKNGGVACIYEDRLLADRCPSTIAEMAQYIESICSKAQDIQKFAVIERVHSMPGQGVVSTFTFGQNFGAWKAILSSYKIPYVETTPYKWMKTFGSFSGMDKKERKHRLKEIALQQYPGYKINLTIADAILIAVYCREQYINNRRA